MNIVGLGIRDIHNWDGVWVFGKVVSGAHGFPSNVSNNNYVISMFTGTVSRREICVFKFFHAVLEPIRFHTFFFISHRALSD